MLHPAADSVLSAVTARLLGHGRNGSITIRGGVDVDMIRTKDTFHDIFSLIVSAPEKPINHKFKFVN